MKHFILNIFFFCLLVSVVFAQPDNLWMRTYGGDFQDIFFDVYNVVDGGYIMTGFTEVAGERPQPRKVWLQRVDREGNPIWDQSYILFDDPISHDYGRSVIETDQGNFLVGGEYNNREFSQFLVKLVSENGDPIWEFVYGGGDRGACRAVIETKGGEFLCAGQIRRDDDNQAYAVMINGEGAVIWENDYGIQGRSDLFRSIRETQGGYVLGGHAGGAGAWKIDADGEVIWGETYFDEQWGSTVTGVSSRLGGFAMGGNLSVRDINGRPAGDMRLVLINADGFQDLVEIYPMEAIQGCDCIARVWDSGFMLSGFTYNGADIGFVIRTNQAGEVLWMRADRPAGRYWSCIEDAENYLLVAGTTGGQAQGILAKIIPDRTPPEIVDWEPENLELNILQSDSVYFRIEAVDLQEDSLRYRWQIRDEVLSNQPETIIPFDELGDFIVTGLVSDGVLADSLRWMVHVREFFINGYEPENLEMNVRRNRIVDFLIDVQSVEEVEVAYEWILRDIRAEADSIVSEEETVSLHFIYPRVYRLRGIAGANGDFEEVSWNIHVISSIWEWLPLELELSTYVDSTLEFSVIPFNPDSDSLEYIWLLDNEQLDIDTSFIELSFPEINQYEVTSVVRDGIEVDTILWTVDVQEWSFTADDADFADFPSTPVLYPASPNPFNSSVKLSLYSPKVNHVSLSIFDIKGREVSQLIDGNVGAGSLSLIWDASNYPAGVYLVRMSAGSEFRFLKIVQVL